MLDFVEETRTIFRRYWDTVESHRLQHSYTKSLAIDHQLPNWISKMSGMSGRKYRYLINNYISMTPDARYLEIGSWKGSTSCSAVYNNACKATLIDNWCEMFDNITGSDVKKEFEQNIQKAKNLSEVTVFDSDFRSIDYSAIGKYNIYMFDGPHDEIDQYDGIMMAAPALDDIYFLIVDDWNWDTVKSGTFRALKEQNSTLISSIEIITRHDQNHPKICREYSDWHNGYLLAIIQK